MNTGFETGILQYLMSIIGIDFAELADLTPIQAMIIIFGCLVGIYVLLFIVRAVLGGSMYMFR